MSEASEPDPIAPWREPTYPIRTERLRLRPFRDDDVEDVLAYQSRDDVTRYLYWGPRTRDEVTEVVRKKMSFRALVAEGDVLALVIELAETDGVIGDVILSLVSVPHRTAEIGYLLHPDHQGHGYATEASRALLRIAFEDLRLHRVVAQLEARNDASARVLERLGMRREAHVIESEWVRGEWQSGIEYGILAREWFAAQEEAAG
jgi:RimJ/RimL family protein N-acetyltransferase